MRRRTVVGTLGSLSLAGCLRLSREETDESGSEPSEPANDSPAERTEQGSDPSGNVIWVAPADGDSGDGSQEDPILDLQHALNVAEPGDTIRLKSGEYRTNVSTTNGGEPGTPITLTGPPDAVVRAAEGGKTVFGILHSHFHVRGLTFNGLADPDRMWEDEDAWARTVVSVSPGPRFEQGVDYLEDVVFKPHGVGNAGYTLVNVERTQGGEFGDFEVTGPAGAVYHPRMDDPAEAHHASIVNVGATTKTIEEYKPWDTLDRSRDIHVHHIDNSAGYHHSQFAIIRLGSENVTVEYCTDRNSGNETSGKDSVPAINVGGNNCTIRGNDVGDCRQGVELSAWTPIGMADAENWARNNDIYTNRFQGVAREVFLFHESSPEAQRTICDNRLVGVDGDEYAYATGECGGDVPDVAGIGHTADQ